MTIGWETVEGATGYKVSQSDDGSTWTEVGTAAATAMSHMVSGLTSETSYYLMVEPVGVSKALANNMGMDTTIKAEKVAHLDFNGLDLGEALYVENTVTSERDSTVNGPINVIDIGGQVTSYSGHFKSGIKGLQFNARDLPPISTWVRLYNTMMPVVGAWNHRTIAFWLKMGDDDQATAISFGKRGGMALTVKDGKMHALTGMRTHFGSGSGNSWWCDSTGADFADTGWVHVAYQFSNPVTRLFINGELADESDGIGYWDRSKSPTQPLPWPNVMEINEPSSTTGVSAEIGALFDPNAAMVYYLGDTWDPGVHAAYALNGGMADIQFFNYALSAEEIKDKIIHFGEGNPEGANGGIILMHLATSRPVEDRVHLQLSAIIEGLQKRGYNLSSVGEVISFYGGSVYSEQAKENEPVKNLWVSKGKDSNTIKERKRRAVSSSSQRLP